MDDFDNTKTESDLMAENQKLRENLQKEITRKEEYLKMYLDSSKENTLLVDQLNMMKLAMFDIDPDKFESRILHRFSELWVSDMTPELTEKYYRVMVNSASAISIASEKYKFSLHKIRITREKRERDGSSNTVTSIPK